MACAGDGDRSGPRSGRKQHGEPQQSAPACWQQLFADRFSGPAAKAAPAGRKGTPAALKLIASTATSKTREVARFDFMAIELYATVKPRVWSTEKNLRASPTNRIGGRRWRPVSGSPSIPNSPLLVRERVAEAGGEAGSQDAGAVDQVGLVGEVFQAQADSVLVGGAEGMAGAEV